MILIGMGFCKVQNDCQQLYSQSQIKKNLLAIRQKIF